LLEVELWAELRREHFVRGVSIKKLARRTGLSRNTIRKALRSDAPPAYRREPAGSMLDSFKDEIHRLLRDDPTLTGVRIREELVPLEFAGSKTIVDDYLREVRPMFLKPRTFQRTVYRPGEVCQWDRWEPSALVPVGHGQVRRAWVLVCCLGYSRAGAGALIFGKEAPDVLWGMTPLLVAGRRAAAADGVGPGGVPACWWRPADRELCGVLRAAAGRLALLRARGSSAEGAGLILHLLVLMGLVLGRSAASRGV
jgi:hypothetical protein